MDRADARQRVVTRSERPCQQEGDLGLRLCGALAREVGERAVVPDALGVEPPHDRLADAEEAHRPRAGRADLPACGRAEPVRLCLGETVTLLEADRAGRVG